MFKLSKSYLLLSLVVVFAFIYRIFLMLRAAYPPSADLGLHNSVIYSITQSGNTDFLWNYFNMGEGVSLTFPGYHIFVSYIILLTGMPDYLVHVFVAALFSSLIVLVAFLITRKISNVSAALIVAFLVAISSFDIEMLMWGGYPNVVTLMLIPLTFYLFMQKSKFSWFSFFAVTSLLSAAIFLTHTLSAVIFVAITFATFIFAVVFSNRFAVRRIHAFIWILPLILGAVIISPFLFDALPMFLGANKDTLMGDASGVRLAMLSTQSVALDFVFPLIFYVLLIFVFSRKQNGKFFTIPAFLLSLWILIPAMGSQSYLVGFYTDYNRFRYFVYLPVIILFGVVFDYASGFSAKLIDLGLSKVETLPKLRGRARKILLRLLPALSRKPLYAIFVIVLLLYSLFSTTMFLSPSRGIAMQEFYQVMDDPLYEAMQWAKSNTPAGSVFAADAKYGWWLAGFTQRQILSGSEPQFLILSREFEPAKNVLNLLDTNYILDNGIIQVREDGGYIGRHNPIFLAKLNNSYFPYGFFHFNNDEITVKCRIGDGLFNFSLSDLPVKDMHAESTSSNATIVITRGNEFFNCTQLTTVYQGVRFANTSMRLETGLSDVHLDWARFILHTKYAQRFEAANTFAFFDSQMNVIAQLVFTKNLPQTTVQTAENPSSVVLEYNLAGKSQAEMELFIGVFQTPIIYSDAETQTSYLSNLILNNTKFYSAKVADLPLNVFNYQSFLETWGVSYVVIRDAEVLVRFANDPKFSLVFANNEVTIFKVNSNTQ